MEKVLYDDHAQNQKGNTAIESFDQETEPHLRHQSRNRPQMTTPHHRRRSQDRTRQPRSAVLSQAEEALIVAFRRHTLLPLDDCLCTQTDHCQPHPFVPP